MTDPFHSALHELLADAADAHEPAPDWQDVQRRAAERPRASTPRRAWIAAAAAAAAVLALVAAAVVQGLVDDDRSVRTVEEVEVPEHASFRTGPLWAPVDLPAGAPLDSDELVAILRPGDVAVLTPEAKIVRTLVSASRTTGVVLSPDRRTVLYQQHTGGCGERLLAVAADGTSGPVVVRDGVRAAALSPSGKTLGLIRTRECDRGPLVVELAPVAGGRADQFVAPVNAWQAPWHTSLAFSSERELLTSALWPEPDRPGAQPLIRVDFGRRTVAPVRSELGSSGVLYLVDRAGDGRITAVERCCEGDRRATLRLVTIADGEIVAAAGPDLLLGSSYLDLGDYLKTAGRGPEGSVFSTFGLGSSHLVIDGVERFIPMPWPQQRLILAADW